MSEAAATTPAASASNLHKSAMRYVFLAVAIAALIALRLLAARC